MPPVLLAFLSSFVAKFYFLIFPYDFACVFLSGSYVGYVGYDLMHCKVLFGYKFNKIWFIRLFTSWKTIRSAYPRNEDVSYGSSL